MDVKVSAEELEFVAHRLFPQDWRRLGRKLLTTIDPHFPNVEGILGNLEFKHQDEGVRRIVLQTMLRWQSMWGDRATVALLVRALEDLELTGIADGLREMIAARNDPTVQRSGHGGIKSKEDGDPIIQICREALKNHYTAMYESTFPLRWRDFGINVQTTYIPVQVIRLDRAPSEKLSPQPDVEVSLDQKTMMFQGPAGVGKSLLCYKMACDWVAEKDSRLKNIQLLFVLSAMSIGTGDILDAVYDQIFPVGFIDKVPKSKLERWINANASSVMFIIDDVDVVQETYSSSDVSKNPVFLYIQGKYLRNTRSILTCRSSAMIDCYCPAQTTAILPSCDAHFLINGFSEGGVDEFICRFFSGSEDSRAMGRRLKEAIRSNDHLSDMVQNPLYAFMVCSLWQRGKAPPINLAQLIEEFIVLISDQYCSSKTPSMSKESIQTILDSVTNLAWSSLEVDSNAMTYEDIQDAVGNDIAIHMGLLVPVKSARREDQYKFVHRVFCEYFAAKFISTPSAAGDHAKNLQTCWSTGCISGNKYGNVCLFAAGLLRDKSRDLFAAFNTNLSDMITQGYSLCCLNTAIGQACRAITESGHPNLTAPLVAKALPKELILDFRGNPPPQSVLHGLAALITTKHFPNTLSLRNLWVTKSSILLHLGEAIKNSKRLSTLRVDVTGMDMTLSNPERTDNSGIVAFHRCIAENRGITCLHVTADLNAMDGKAVAAIPEVMERKTDLLVLELIITASTSCSTRCRDLVTKGYKTGCKSEKNIQVFNETFADTLGRNKTLQSLCMSVHLLKHKSALELVAPAIASHPRISSFRVSGLPDYENYTHGYEIEALAHILLKSKILKSFSLGLPSLIGDTHHDVSAQQRVNILCAALKQCRTLEKLELTFTYLFAKEKLLLADVIKSGRSLKEVSLTWRNMNEGFLVAFSRAIRAKPARSLQEITLSGAFDSRGLVRLGKAVVNSQSLMKVTLQHSKFHDKGLEEFVDEVMEAVASFPEERDVPLHITLQGAVDGECTDDAISTAELLSMELQDSDYANLTVHLEPDNPESPAFHTPVKKSSDFTFIVDLEIGDTSGNQQEQAMRWLTRR